MLDRGLVLVVVLAAAACGDRKVSGAPDGAASCVVEEAPAGTITRCGSPELDCCGLPWCGPDLPSHASFCASHAPGTTKCCGCSDLNATGAFRWDVWNMECGLLLPPDAGPSDGSTGPAPVGSPCVKNSDCVSVQCLTDEVAHTLLQHEVHTYGGYCILFPCDPARHDADCGPGAHCFDGQPYGADMFICFEACYSLADCTRIDYVCIGNPAADGGAQVGACVPGDLFQIDGGA